MPLHASRDWRSLRSATLLLTLVTLPACGEDPAAPGPALASIAVSAPVGSVLATGVAVELSASALDTDGKPLTVSVDWTSSAPSVAIVSSTGVVATLQPGTVRIEARSGTVAGHIDFSVVHVDTESIRTLLDDPFTAALVGGAGTSAGDVAGALADADAALAAGDVLAVESAFDAVRAMAAGATDPDPRALLAVLILIVGHAQAHLGL